MNPAFRPIDAVAKSGAFHLLKDEDEHQHCGRWNRATGVFTYSSGKPIPGHVRSYSTRHAEPQRQPEGAN